MLATEQKKTQKDKIPIGAKVGLPSVPKAGKIKINPTIQAVVPPLKLNQA